MTDLQLFEFERKPIRTVLVEDQIWFVAKDVCESLDVAWSSRTLDSIKPASRRVMELITPRGSQMVTMISESAVYRLAFRSRSLVAERFADWVTEEVLPQIRRTGTYQPNHGILPMNSHTNVAIQKAMSKVVNSYNYRKGGKKRAINHNIQNCKAQSGKTPKQWMAIAKQKGWKTRERRSGKDVLRKLMPEAACAESLADNLVEQGYDSQKVFEITPQSKALFAGMLQLGAVPPELNQLERK